jgi:hypothetical protein
MTLTNQQRSRIIRRLARLGVRCDGKLPNGPEVRGYGRMWAGLVRVLGYGAAYRIRSEAANLERRHYYGDPI